VEKYLGSQSAGLGPFTLEAKGIGVFLGPAPVPAVLRRRGLRDARPAILNLRVLPLHACT